MHFEICVLANLAPGDAEEAKLMVPSLVVCARVISACIMSVIRTCLAKRCSMLPTALVVVQGKVTEEDLAQIVDEIATYR